MKKILTILAGSLFLVLLNGCGAPDDNGSGLSAAPAAALANLKGETVGFNCNTNVVVVKVTNNGQINVPSSFVRLEQTGTPSQAFGISALKVGQSQNIGVTVRNNGRNAKIKVDGFEQIIESNEADNLIVLPCN